MKQGTRVVLKQIMVSTLGLMICGGLSACTTQTTNQEQNPQEVAPVASPLMSPGKILASSAQPNDLVATKPTEEIRVLSAAKSIDKEPNNSSANAVEYVLADNRVSGQLSKKGDEDFLLVRATANGNVTFTMQLAKETDYTFDIQNADGEVLATMQRANALGGSLEVKLEVGGNYYLHVYSPSNAFDASGQADYELSNSLGN